MQLHPGSFVPLFNLGRSEYSLVLKSDRLELFLMLQESYFISGASYIQQNFIIQLLFTRLYWELRSAESELMQDPHNWSAACFLEHEDFGSTNLIPGKLPEGELLAISLGTTFFVYRNGPKRSRHVIASSRRKPRPREKQVNTVRRVLFVASSARVILKVSSSMDDRFDSKVDPKCERSCHKR
uniref:Uncharacterized protein n=1 Tax=Timema poppense TaxID=170557 RepID=A0A7R9H9P7_TIMPO|nr:unnamed protein product [Timema poppensis]